MPDRVIIAGSPRHILRLIQVHLQGAGYGVKVCFDAAKVPSLATNDPPDLIILDITDDVRVFEVVVMLKREASTQQIPVLLIVPKPLDHNPYNGYQTGFDCYITAPFQGSELVAFARRMIESNRPATLKDDVSTPIDHDKPDENR